MEVNAGDFERYFSKLLSSKIYQGVDLSFELIVQCYRETGNVLGLKAMPSDNLRIKDIYSTLKAVRSSVRSAEEIPRAVCSTSPVDPGLHLAIFALVPNVPDVLGILDVALVVDHSGNGHEGNAGLASNIGHRYTVGHSEKRSSSIAC